MRPIILILATLVITACGKSSPSDADQPAPGFQVNTIPDQSCVMHSTGTREFCDDSHTLTSATAYDCGVREAKHCWYFYHDENLSDVICAPYGLSLSCEYLVKKQVVLN